MNFEDLLHRSVANAALGQLKNGHARDATLNAVVALFDLIRARTGLTIDGVELADHVFSIKRPRLVVGDLQTESGRNAQLGVMALVRGLYQGVRNPTAHTIPTEIDEVQAARYLVVASALARIVEEAELGDVLRFDGVYASAQGSDGGGSFLRFFSCTPQKLTRRCFPGCNGGVDRRDARCRRHRCAAGM